MHTIDVETLSTRDLLSRLKVTGNPTRAYLALRRAQALSQPVAIEATISVGTEDFSALVFLVPGLSAEKLLELGSCRQECYIDESADLRTRTAYIAWVASDIEARVNCWQLQDFVPRVGQRRFVVAFASGENAVIATNTLGLDEMDALIADLQCCCVAGGPNYQPWRDHSDEALDQSEGLVDIVEERVLTAPVWVNLD